MCLLPDFGEYPGGGVSLSRGGQLEESMRGGPPRVNNALWNPLVVEMRYLLAKDEILQQGRTAEIGHERVWIVGKRNALVRGQRRVLPDTELVGTGRPIRTGLQLKASSPDKPP